MINYPVLGIFQKLYFMAHQVAWKLRCRPSSIYKSPHNAVILTFFIKLDKTDRIFGLILYISEKFARTGYQKILSCKIRNRSTYFPPFSCFQFFFNLRNFTGFNSVRKITSVSFVPSHIPAISRHSYKTFYKFRI